MEKNKINNIEAFKKEIENHNIHIRHDSYQNQLSDLYPVFVSLNLTSLTEILYSNNLIYDNTCHREEYLNIIDKIDLNIETIPYNHILTGKNICKIFNCVNAYEYLNNYFVNNI